MFKMFLTIATLAICTSFFGCGRTGALYIPEQRYPLPTQDETQKEPVATPHNQPTKE
jgi:predicted small lipoprotein YifL